MNLSTQKRVIYVFGGVISILLIVIIVLSALLGKSNNKLNDSSDLKVDLCTTKECISAANHMLQNMDLSVDPCEDFSQFSCGSFLNRTRIPDDQTYVDASFYPLTKNIESAVIDLLTEEVASSDIEPIRNAKRFFKSCMNELAVETNGETKLKEFVKNVLKGFPVIGNDHWNETDFDPADTLVISRDYGIKQIVDVSVTINPKDARYFNLKLMQPTWMLPKELYNDNSTYEAYHEFVFKFVKLMGSTIPDGEIKAQVDAVFSIEKTLAECKVSADQKRNSTFRNTTMKQLIETFPQFEWKDYIIDGMFRNYKNITITTDEVILVEDWSYFEKVVVLYGNLKANQTRDLKNFFVWAFISQYSDSLPKRYRELEQDYDKVVNGISTPPSRSETCVNVVLRRMEYIAGRMYIDRVFDKTARQTLAEQVEYLRNEFIKVLETNDWMDKESKTKAIEKARTMQSKVAYPDFLFDDAYMKNLYKEFKFTEDDHFTNTLTLFAARSADELTSLREEKNRTRWIRPVAEVNAYYSHNLNDIRIPAGILQAPIYDVKNPNYLNFGAIGMVIGHEITHGFDDKGRLYDKEGVFYGDDTLGLWSNTYVEYAQQLNSNFYPTTFYKELFRITRTVHSV